MSELTTLTPVAVSIQGAESTTFAFIWIRYADSDDEFLVFDGIEFLPPFSENSVTSRPKGDDTLINFEVLPELGWEREVAKFRVEAAEAPVGPPVSDYVHWIDPSVIENVTFRTTVGDGEDIDEVLDLSGGDNHWDAFSSLDLSDPTWEADSQNGLGMVNMGAAGNSRSLTLADPSDFIGQTSDGEVWLVLKPNFGGNQAFGVLGRFAGTHLYPFAALHPSAGIYTTAGSSVDRNNISQNPAGVIANPHLLNIVGSTTEWTMYINDLVQLTTGTNSPVWFTALGSWYLGWENWTGGSYLGSIGEFIVFDRVLSGPERTSMRDYLNDKWGLGF